MSLSPSVRKLLFNESLHWFKPHVNFQLSNIFLVCLLPPTPILNVLEQTVSDIAWTCVPPLYLDLLDHYQKVLFGHSVPKSCSSR